MIIKWHYVHQPPSNNFSNPNEDYTIILMMLDLIHLLTIPVLVFIKEI